MKLLLNINLKYIFTVYEAIFLWFDYVTLQENTITFSGNVRNF